MCTENCQNRERFGTDIANIKRCSLFASHCSRMGLGAGGNGNNQWDWEGNGNKTRLNLGERMGMNYALGTKWTGIEKGISSHSSAQQGSVIDAICLCQVI